MGQGTDDGCPWYRLLHLAGRDEALQPAERAARGRGRAQRRGRRLAGPGPLPADPPERGLAPFPLAPVPRRPHRHEHPAGLRVFLERRDDLAAAVRRRTGNLRGRGGFPPGHPGSGHAARPLQPVRRPAPGSRDRRCRRGPGLRRPGPDGPRAAPVGRQAGLRGRSPVRRIRGVRSPQGQLFHRQDEPESGRFHP